MNETIRLSDSWPLILTIGALVGLAYAYLVHLIRCHPRYGWYWIQHAWSLVVIGNGMVALFAGWVLSSWVVFGAILATNAVLGIWQIIGALIDAARTQQNVNEEHHAETIHARRA